jgi:hypothetical protein
MNKFLQHHDMVDKAYAVVPGDPSTASFGGFVVGPMHAAVRAAAAGFRPYFMHGSGFCGGNQLHASGTWDNGISLG